MDTTAILLGRVRRGDNDAREQLLRRYLPVLERWAHGRLPSYARGSVDTEDLVQVTLIKSLDHLERFEPRREGAFLAYLRQILLNSIRDEIRGSKRRPASTGLNEEHPDCLPSAVELAIGKEMVEHYERGLDRLEERRRESVILRLEFGMSYKEVADAVGCPSANAARMLVSRALVDLAEQLDVER